MDVDVVERQPELLGHHLRHGGARAGEIDGAHGHHRPAVAGDGDVRRRGHRRAAPVAERQAAPAGIAALGQRVPPAGMLADPVEDGGQADGRERRADRHGAAGDGGVALAELERVHVEPLAQRVHRLLHGEVRLDAAGPAIGLGARLVGDDVEALQVEVGALVERGRRLHDERGAQARQAAGVQAIGAVDGDEAAIPVGADGDVDQRRGGGTGAALQHLLAREDQLDRAAAFLRQPHRHGLAMDGDLAAEAAADLERHHLELRLRQPEHARDHQLGRELALGGGPHRGEAVGIDLGHHHLRLQVALVRGVDLDARLRGGGRLAERARGVAAGDDDARAHVARRPRPRLHALGEDVLVQDRGIGRHGRGDIEHGGERLVVDLDQRQRGLARHAGRSRRPPPPAVRPSAPCGAPS